MKTDSGGHYGTQVKGALIMFMTVVLTASITANADARDAEFGRWVLGYLFVGVCSVVLFVTFFVGLKVFTGGLLREAAGHLPDAEPGEREGGEKPSQPSPSAAPPTHFGWRSLGVSMLGLFVVIVGLDGLLHAVTDEREWRAALFGVVAFAGTFVVFWPIVSGILRVRSH